MDHKKLEIYQLLTYHCILIIIIISYELIAYRDNKVISGTKKIYTLGTYRNIIFEIDIQNCEKIIILISNHRRWACAMFLCKGNCNIIKSEY